LSTLAQGRSYTAAVVEYSPLGSILDSGRDVLLSNLVNYDHLIEEAASTFGADIIVFPEYGLTTLAVAAMPRSLARSYLQQFPPLNNSASASECVQDYRNYPVEDDRLVFTYLSCSARRHAIYVAVDIGEYVPCSPGQNVSDSGVCPEDGAFHYNSNIVFDRQGRLVGRYRKTHLFLEDPPFNSPPRADHVTVATDFGVDFGLIICFDILYYEPAQILYRDMGVRDFIFTTAWGDELPFLTAVQVQESWARSLGVNLLASNYHLPRLGKLGSGIYGPNGHTIYTSDPASGTKLLIAQVSKDGDDSALSAAEISTNQVFHKEGWQEPHYVLHENLTGYTSLEIGTGAQDQILCHRDLCCHFNVSTSCAGDQRCDKYRLLAYGGTRFVGNGHYEIGVQLCGMVACSGPDADSCAHPDTQPATTIDYMEIRGNFTALTVLPTVLDKDLLLPPNGHWNFDADGGAAVLTGLTPLKDVLCVGLYARDYEKDKL